MAKVAKTVQKEFGGAFGACVLLVFMPFIILYLNLSCSKGDCNIFNYSKLLSLDMSRLVDFEAICIYVGWFFFQAFLYMLPTGTVAEGLPLNNGKKLRYRCNGFVSLLISIAAFGVLVYLKYPIEIVHEKFIQLAVASILFSFALALFVYIKSWSCPNWALAPSGNSGNFVYDFFMGHELNPRIGSFDIKFFCELRPGLIGWVMLNLTFVYIDLTKNPEPNYGLQLSAAFQIWYVVDALWHEEAVLSTMDIVYEGFGFMLACGDHAWVPFLYTLSSRYLLESPVMHPLLLYVFVFVINCIGYVTFRMSNSEKNAFRKNPNHPRFAKYSLIPTKSGKKLLASGWWSISRHPNYMGDILMALAWSLPCGMGHLIPWFYPVYFTILLVHREARDEHNCHEKYGTAWDEYCKRVKYRIFPFLY